MQDPVNAGLPVVYGITPRWAIASLAGEGIPLLRQLLEAGNLVQLRQKHWTSRQLIEWLGPLQSSLSPVARRRLLVNERCDVALAFEDIGVHVPENGMPLDVVRKILGGHRLMGVSCHEQRRLHEAKAAGADLVTLGPVFETPGKGPALTEAALSGLAWPEGLRIFALGGIDPGNIGRLGQAGWHGVAAIRSIFEDPDPLQAAARLRQQWELRANQG